MLRFRKYICPVRSIQYPDHPVFSHCLYEGHPFPIRNANCIGCGKLYKETFTIWDKTEDLYHTVIPYEYRPHALWRKFKCWAWYRYTTTKPRTLGNEWCDSDHLLLHTIFEIARTFLEKEGPKTEKEWADQKEANPEFYASWLETKEILDWWIARGDDYPWDMPDDEFDKMYPWKMPPADEYTGTEYERRCYEKLLIEDKHKTEVRAKAQRIIDISPYYWT